MWLDHQRQKRPREGQKERNLTKKKRKEVVNYNILKISNKRQFAKCINLCFEAYTFIAL